MLLAGFGLVLVFFAALAFGVFMGIYIVGRSMKHRPYWAAFCHMAGITRSESVYFAFYGAFLEEFGHFPRWPVAANEVSSFQSGEPQ